MHAVAYRARIFGDNPLHKIFNDHWQNFVGAYEERFQQTCGALRGTAKRVVKRFLDCGNPMNGFARIKCSTCGAERLLHFSCKTRGFCPSCQARQSEEWAGWFADELSESVFHRQMVFTIPKILRAYFHYDRKLLTDLSRAAHRAVSRFGETGYPPLAGGCGGYLNLAGRNFISSSSAKPKNLSRSTRLFSTVPPV